MAIGGNHAVGRFNVQLKLSNNKDRIRAEDGTIDAADIRSVTIDGVVDSGATRLVLPEAAVKRLGLSANKKVRVRYADRRSALRDAVEEVRVELQGRSGTFTAVVEPDRRIALIGAIVLEDLDFVVDCTAQKLVPRNSRYIVSEIE